MIDLIQGDCFDYLKEMESESVDCIISDPPFGGITECHWDSKIDVVELHKQLSRIIKPQGSVLLFCQQPFTTDLINANRDEFKYLWYWFKNRNGATFAHAKNRPLSRIEEIAVFSKGAVAHAGRSTRRMNYYPQGAVPGELRTIKKDDSPNHRPRPLQVGRTYQQWTGFPHNVLTYAKPPKSWHPTAKPIDLLRFLIRSYTLPGELVLDPFMGSGSTVKAALLEGRRAIGIERDSDYFSRVVKEIEDGNK
ncbi:MAG: site-specific DNA-methyltransferase [Gemmatales bacterium]